MLRRRGLPSLVMVCLLGLFLANVARAEDHAATQEELQKLSQQASNPVGQLWMIANQFNLNVLKSDTVKLFKGQQDQFIWNFQPVMPIGLSESVRVILRPVVPFVSSPHIAGPRDLHYTSGIGDIGLQAVLAPNTDALTGFMWGVGPSLIMPTAANNYLGKGKWQLGPAVAALYVSDKWVVGVYPQHWWSFAGDSRRDNVSYSNLQYFLWYSPAPTWQVGMSPNVTIDWVQEKPEDRLTFPIGLGVSKMFRLGKLPIKISFEADYSIIRPRNVPGNEWTFRLNFTPIIKSLL